MPAPAVVIGAGVVGLTTAVSLAEAGRDVRVDAELLPGATTSAAAGASWDPFLAEPADLVERWSKETLSLLLELATDDGTGVRLVEGTHESRVPRDVPAWAPWVDAGPCAPGDLRPGYVEGWRYRAPVVDMPRYMGYLADRLAQAGGRLRQHRYASLEEALSEAPVIVNCTGTGARALVGDSSVEAVRGQLVVVENPGITTFFCDDTPEADELTYFYPQSDVVVLGGTSDRGNWDLRPDGAAAADILRRCAQIEPSLADARVVGHRVGLRPVRPRVRLDTENRDGALVLHNYGHGGAGLTLSWGCAREAVDLLHAAE
ncbi:MULTISPECIES: FAD-dependent oxidoreductase [unclassified Streptomyces]|uniref:FAD-dependent oxidoreductase n=1 Tax=unclassified Streptomyces TaxID=2593676 RepID=UPI00070E8AFE|nr:MULTISPECIES: FAD-dependent oxidoreductase [unclassified Streptomyces]KRD24610.1 amino acid oxidase [Streptomyces sp. Root264]